VFLFILYINILSLFIASQQWIRCWFIALRRCVIKTMSKVR